MTVFYFILFDLIAMVNLFESKIWEKNDIKFSDGWDFKNKLLENLNLSDWKENIVFISLKDVPADARKRFEGCSKSFIYSEDYKEWNFEKIWYIQYNFPEPYITYFATQDKEYDTGSIEKLIYLFEKNYEWEKIWHGEIRLCIHNNNEKIFQNFFKDKPFVGFTQTEEDFFKKGYGILRLIHMNQLVTKEFGLKLYSSELPAPWAKRNREKLVEYGLAKQFLDNNWNIRYSFV